MTPKEQAEKLIRSFYPFTYTAVHKQNTSMDTADAIYCAKMAVDKIISVCKEIQKLYHDNDMINSDIDWQPEEYWQDVKQELEK